MDKKQIEEMVKDFKLCCPCEMFTGYIDENGDMQGDKRCLADHACTKCGISTDLAKHLIKQGYCKINENTVIISKNQLAVLLKNASLEDILKLQENKVLCDGTDLDNYDYDEQGCIDCQDKVRKETAKEVLELLEPNCKGCDSTWHKGCLCLRASLAKKIAKHFGVDIGEWK